MKQIWGKSFQRTNYTDKAITLVNERVKECRQIARQEFMKNARDAVDHNRMLYDGTRFKDDEQILWVLESNVPEDKFLDEVDHYIQRVLLGALSTDYYYQFEKQWD